MQPVQQVLAQLDVATASLVSDIGGLTDAGARAPSLLPGWTRGHVLTHLARNAEGGTRLLDWARTGTRSYEYKSVTARAEAIEEGSGRPAAALVADVAAAAGAFASAASAMPARAWQNPITWTTGQRTSAEMVAASRYAEVLIHHVDLNLGFGPGRWPDAFVQEMLGIALAALNERGLAPLSARLLAADTGRDYQLGDSRADQIRVSGTAADLLAWLLGRADGAALEPAGPGPLPPVPSIYFT